jgi:glutathione S-transferase
MIRRSDLINCYAFGSVPSFAQGLVRDLRVRWALEEAGLPYRVTLVGEGAGSLARSRYRLIQPFGQIPAIEDDGLTLFESGAIVLYVAERSRVLLPEDPSGRVHVVQWMFAALNTIEVPIQRLAEIDLFYGEERWARERRPAAVQAVQQRLAELASSATAEAADDALYAVPRVADQIDHLAFSDFESHHIVLVHKYDVPCAVDAAQPIFVTVDGRVELVVAAA